MTLTKVLFGIGGAMLATIIIMSVTTVSVIGIKTLYQHLYQTSEASSSATYKYMIGDTITDVIGFTLNVEEYTKNIGR